MDAFNFRRFSSIAIRLAYAANEGERMQSILKISDKLNNDPNYKDANKELVARNATEVTAKMATCEQEVRHLLARLAGIHEDLDEASQFETFNS